MKTKQTINLIVAVLVIATNQVSATDVRIVRSGSQVILSWPQAATNDFYLQFAANLSAPIAWSNASDAATNGTDLAVTDPTTSLSRFYRLQAWEILFDGTSTAAFRGYKQSTFPRTNVWLITTNKELMAVVVPSGSSIRTNDLITTAQYDNFELRWEWKTSTNGNSGVFIRVTEPVGTNNFSAQTGPEYQLLDDPSYSGLPGYQTMGAAFSLFAPTTNKLLVPTGQWNECRLIVQSNHVQHWLNGGTVLEYDINGPGWATAVANYSGGGPLLPGFAQTTPAPIALQHHGQQVWFRNIKIRKLSPQ